MKKWFRLYNSVGVTFSDIHTKKEPVVWLGRLYEENHKTYCLRSVVLDDGSVFGD